MKQFCTTHRLFYNTNECPLCSKERIENYGRKFKKSLNETNKTRELTEDDLLKLSVMFNRDKRKKR